MFSLSSTSKVAIAGTIHLKKKPVCLGIYTDVNEQQWDIRGIYKDYVQACKIEELHDYYKSTTELNGICGTYGNNIIKQTWLPYLVNLPTKQEAGSPVEQ